ncbi:four helix bundle protein [Chelativorans sp. AA-79]|uniref:four helix bundle protein n=1 Tax=Chelativorans sp. AA-79 TaxID=3028735 RepID=UPI0023F8C2A0|nr:four helix bundle protein [Chelativorans sp. AA-79]WEX07559.1 four helix bundle protein [Chelativorans sp. AA-79]
MPINSYQDLRVWQLAMDLAFDCYKVTRAFPRDELYGMTSQIRRAASSIAANIAEGHGRENTGSFIQFLRIAQGSLKELETYVVLATRLEFIDAKRSAELLGVTEEIGKMIRSMIRRLQEKTA